MPVEASWRKLDAALDARRGRPVSFWWRDDDAVDATPALARLFATVAGRPLALAVIPAQASQGLADAVRAAPAVTVLQHGWSHADHAPAGTRKAELGPHRPFGAIAAELAAGRARLTGLFGDRFLPLLVPPWNRIAPDLLPLLRPLGFVGWSADRPRADASPLPALHAGIDPIDWRAGGGFAGEAVVLDRLVQAIAGDAPVGLLTHHRVIDAAGWAFLARLVPVLAAHAGLDWRDARGLLTNRGYA